MVSWLVGPRRPGHPPLLVSVYWASLVRAPLRFAKGAFRIERLLVGGPCLPANQMRVVFARNNS